MKSIKDGLLDNYLKDLQKRKKQGKKINPIHEIVNTYYEWKGIDKESKEFYKGRFSYGKLAREAKQVYKYYNENLDDTLHAMEQMKYKAEKNNFDWSVITCLKHKNKK